MKKRLIYIFITSLLFPFWSYAQEATSTGNDSIVYKERYGLRLGIDLSKPIRTIIDKDYQGFAVNGDYRFDKKFYAVAELGYESYDFEENYFSAGSEGSYIKLGVNYNAYENWMGMQNEIYVGLRYAFATFSETLYDYTVNNRNPYFPPDNKVVNEEYSGLTAHWIELQLGIKAEIAHNLFLGIHVELKRSLAMQNPDKLETLWVPGYNRVYDGSSFGVGWGYTISYMIPFSKKIKKQSVN